MGKLVAIEDRPDFRVVWDYCDGEDTIFLCHQEDHGFFWLVDDTRLDMAPEDLYDLAATIKRKVPKP